MKFEIIWIAARVFFVLTFICITMVILGRLFRPKESEEAIEENRIYPLLRLPMAKTVKDDRDGDEAIVAVIAVAMVVASLKKVPPKNISPWSACGRSQLMKARDLRGRRWRLV